MTAVKTRTSVQVALLTMILAIGGTVASGHEGLIAVVNLSPGQPRVDDVCQITFKFETTAGRPVELPDARVWFSATMSGHPMPPVETELTSTGGAGARSGSVTFTMAGPWRVSIRMEELDDLMEAEFDLSVAGTDDSRGREAAGNKVYKVQMAEPSRPTLFPPWLVVTGAVVLMMAVMGGAAALRSRSRPAEKKTDATV